MRPNTTRRGFLNKAAATAAGLWLAAAGRAAGVGRLRAGAAVADITPAVGVSLSGPVTTREPVRRIVTPLRARALVLDDGRERIAFVVCDCASIYFSKTADKAKRLVHQRTGLPPERVVISTTHTHAAPRLGLTTLQVDLEYYDLFCRRVAEAVSMAVENLAPAKIGWGTGSKPEFTRCRRNLLEPGTFGLNPFGEEKDRAVMVGWGKATRPTGSVDPQVGVLSVRHADGRPLAVLADYSIHYVSGAKPGDVTADYHGYFADRLATLVGAEAADPPFVGIMARGNAGDTAAYPGGYEAMKEVGGAVAEEVFRVCRQIDYHDRAGLAVRHSTLELGLRQPDAQRIAWAKSVLAGTWRGKAQRGTDVYAKGTLELAKSPATIPFFLQAFRIGELGITTVPCEMFASTGLAIREVSPLRPHFNIDLANGFWGYLPPPEQHKLGGYTTWPTTSSCLEMDAEPKIKRELVRLLASL